MTGSHLRIVVMATCVCFAAPESWTQERVESALVLPTGGSHALHWQRLEAFATRENWEAVLEGLTRHAELAQEASENSVGESGRGLALGIRRLYARVIDSLPDEMRQQYVERRDATLRALWESQAETLSPARRGLLRYRLLRDYPGNSLDVELLREEVDVSFEAGNWHRARAACKRLAETLQRNSTENRIPNARLLEWLECQLALLQLAIILENGSDLRQATAAIERITREPSYDTLAEDVRRRVAAALESAPRVLKSASDTSDSEVRSVFQSETPAASPQTQPFELGDVTFQFALPDSRLRTSMDQIGTSMPHDGLVPLPYFSAAQGDFVLTHHAGRAIALDLKRNSLLWTLEVNEAPNALSTVRVPLLGTDECYLVYDSSLVAVHRDSGQLRWRIWFDYDAANGEIVAAAHPPDRHSDKTPAESEASTPPLCLLSPPALHAENLVVPITVRHGQDFLVYMICLNTDGRTRWQTYLGSSGNSNYLGLGGYSSPPLSIGQSLYVVTNQGFVAALDGEDGVIEWIIEYPRLHALAQQAAIRTANRWLPNPIIHSGEHLVVAPQDSTRLFSIDRRSAALNWSVLREAHSIIVGATEDLCVLSGTSVSAVKLTGPDRGDVAWNLDGEEVRFSPFGRGHVTEGSILIPGRRSLLVLSPKDGSVLSRTFWDRGGAGNLLLCEDALVVTTPEAVCLYGTRGKAAQKLSGRGADNRVKHLLRAKHEFRANAVNVGLQHLDEWWSANPQPPVPNSDEDSLHLELADLLAALSTTEAVDAIRLRLLTFRVRLENTAERKIRAAVALADALEASGQAAAALAHLHAALEVDRGATEYSPTPLLSVSSDAYLRDRIRRLRRQSAEPQRVFEAVETAAAARLAEARQKSTPILYQEVIRTYPFTRAAAAAYLDLSQRYRDRLSLQQAAGALEGYVRDYADDPQIDRGELVRVHLHLVNLLFQSGERQKAKELSLAVIEQFGDDTVDGVGNMKSGETVRDYLEPRLRDPGLIGLPAGAPKTLRAPLRKAWRSPANLEAVSRLFLVPEGDAPAALDGTFLTQSNEMVDLRGVDTGLYKWRVNLSLIPGFVLNSGTYFSTLPRHGPRALRGRFVDALLILFDRSNLFAIDTENGLVKWHVPFGENTKNLRQLREQLLHVEIDAGGLFALTSRGTLFRYSIDGERIWEVQLTYEPDHVKHVFALEKIFIFSKAPAGIHVHDATTGALLRRIAGERATLRPERIVLPGHRLLVPYRGRVDLFDLRSEQTLWSYAPDRGKGFIRTLNHFEDFPNECIILLNRAGNHPALVSISTTTGTERWRYEGFPSRRSRFSIFRDGQQLYVVHGDDHWELLALELRPGGGVDRAVIGKVWPSEPNLGTFYSSQWRLYLAPGLIIFHDPNNSISVFDRKKGTGRPEVAEQVNQFLEEKGSFASALIDGRFVVLSDGGDAAFESDTESEQRFFTDTPLLKSWLSEPNDTTVLTRLAQEFLRKDKIEEAIRLVDRSLLEEESVGGQSRQEQLLAQFVLDGLKQEHMERQFKRGRSMPEITSRRLPHPPTIDGRLNDWWDIGSRLDLNTPRYIGSIPGPKILQHWEGEEDLSGTLYTGWDENYFYFAFDVTDDVLHPYDRDAENWKGDCLIIGVDPTADKGYRQHGTDLLMTLALTVPKRRNEDKLSDEDEESGEDTDEDEKEEEDEEEGEKPDGKFAVKRKLDNTGAIYEVALPWSTFSGEFSPQNPPPKGYRFGLSLLLTDDDTGQGATKTLSLNPCHLLPYSQKSNLVWRFIVPNFFPQVRLD